MTVAAEQQDKGLPFGWKNRGGFLEASRLLLAQALLRFGACGAEFLARAARSDRKTAPEPRALSLACEVSNYFERRVYLPNQNILTEGEEPRYGAPRRN